MYLEPAKTLWKDEYHPYLVHTKHSSMSQHPFHSEDNTFKFKPGQTCGSTEDEILGNIQSNIRSPKLALNYFVAIRYI